MKYEQIPILMYHNVSELNNYSEINNIVHQESLSVRKRHLVDYNERTKDRRTFVSDYNLWSISLREFQKQMNFLKEQGYKTISLSQLRDYLKEDLKDIELKDIKLPPEKLIVITFDDARKGVYQYAFPILKGLGFSATIFIVPKWIEEPESIPQNERYSDFLNWNQLRELQQSSFELGSHSYSHQDLTRLTAKEITFELNNSKKIIAERTGIEVQHFSYPYGKFNPPLSEEVGKVYQTAVSTTKGLSKSKYQYSRQWILNNTSLLNFQKLLNPLKLSLCMIVKNEEKHLGYALKAIQDLVDEIIIVDTGSTDRSKEIAARFTSKIFDFKWCDDFSAARNEALKHSSGDWILILDADEMIPKENHFLIEEALNNWNIQGYKILTKNYSNESNVSGFVAWDDSEEERKKISKGWYPSIKVRLFQNQKNICFTGRVHEVIDYSIIYAQGKISELNASVHHLGTLNSDKLLDKTKKYLEINQTQVLADPQNSKAYFELGVENKNLGKLDLAEKLFEKSLSLDQTFNYLALLNLAVVQQKQNKYLEAIENYQKIITENPNSPEAHFGIGFCNFKLNKIPEAIESFQLSIKNNPNYLDAYINLAALFEKTEKFPEAINCIKEALRIDKNNPRAYYNLAVVHEKTFNLELAAKCYQKAIILGYPKKEIALERIIIINEFLKKNKESTS